MATPSPASKNECMACHKAETNEHRLRLCSRCRTTLYCSRDCQKTHWKAHRFLCTEQVDLAMRMVVFLGTELLQFDPIDRPGTSHGLQLHHHKPFTAIYDQLWLWYRPKMDVYKLLIETYRLRIADDFKENGYIHAGSVYGGAADGGIANFRKFLDKVGSRHDLFPPWWNASHARECVCFGIVPSRWSYLARIVDDTEIRAYYQLPTMPTQLRLFAAQIYGMGPGGKDSRDLLFLHLVNEWECWAVKA
ncbi:MYND domain protein [Penicillium hispanicum]|uniref:MYND domain protein n=1 Tax=Penicillium hispanicum TaxID=1080232 RepID=UPI0025412769|nr:MYND domain protein [Penicillium hispanicum]KAJ5591599.1 MYND domain protein [Penicillium hispanicum]